MDQIDVRLLTAALDGDRAPLLRDALEGLYDLLRSADVEPRLATGARSPAALLQRYGSLEQWLNAGLVTAQAVGQAADDNGAAAWLENGGEPVAWIDRWLVPELLLGLARFPVAQRTHASSWDEELSHALAALVAVDSYRPLLDPNMSPEALLEGPGCHLRPAIARWLPAGRYLAGRLGLESVVGAAAGQVPIAETLEPEDTAVVESLLRSREPSEPIDQLSILPEPFAEQDAAWIEDALLAMLYRRRKADGLSTTVAVLPPGNGLRFDFRNGQLAVLGPRESLAQQVVAGWLDPPFHAIALPPTVCATLAASGWSGVDLQLEHLEGLDDLMDAIFAIMSGDVEQGTVQGDGFRFVTMA